MCLKGHRFFFLCGEEVERIQGKTSNVSNENKLFQWFLTIFILFYYKTNKSQGRKVAKLGYTGL